MSNYEVSNIAAQVFVTGPDSHVELLTDVDKREIAKMISSDQLSVVVHGSYIDFPWNYNNIAIHNIRQELRIARAIHANGVIVHLGKGADTSALDEVLLNIADSDYLSLDVQQHTILWLEVQASKPSKHTYETPEKVVRLFKRIIKLRRQTNMQLKIGLCVDTAHLHSCGVSLSTYSDAKRWFHGIASALSSDVPLMIHLNDSLAVVGSGSDIHAPLCKGHIWSEYHPNTGNKPYNGSGLHFIVEFCMQHGYMMIMERDPDQEHTDLALLTSADSI